MHGFAERAVHEPRLPHAMAELSLERERAPVA